MTTAIDVTNVINVSISEGQSLLTAKNVNNLVIFSNETPGFSDVFRLYVDATSVANDFGVNSLTFQMANGIFSQSPNILTGSGILTIIPLLNSVSATSGSFSTKSIETNLANFKTVTNGAFNIDIDGASEPISIGGLNFSNIQEANYLNDIINIIQNKLQDVIVTAGQSSSGGSEIVFTSKKVGIGTGVVLTSPTSGTDITGSTYLDITTGSAINGSNAAGETIEAAILRTYGSVSFTGILTTLLMEDAVKKALMTYCQGIDSLLYIPITTTADFTNIGTYAVLGTLNHSRVLGYTTNLVDATLFCAAYASRGQCVDFTGSNTMITMNLKSLSGITPDSGINQTLYILANQAGVDIYVNYAIAGTVAATGVPAVVSNGANDYFDDVYSNLAIKFDAQAADFNFLRSTTTKIMQTEAGMSAFKDVDIAIAKQYVNNGVIGVGLNWNGSIPFGDPEDFKRSITSYGYYIYSMPISQQSQAARQNRIAPIKQLAIKKSGAIHSSQLVINVQQ